MTFLIPNKIFLLSLFFPVLLIIYRQLYLILGEHIGESKPQESGVNGSSIVLGIIIVILVVGALGMGYKYWRSHRGYHNTRTDDIEEGKELKMISTNNKLTAEEE